ncbi:hypothetical protein [Priestia megaterium]|uniref:hypothetical protein n=1 Tax=Priestia megaterium TaxID=1404 RepID=UPI003100D127
MNKYLEKHSNYVFGTKNRPGYINDLNEISEETTTLYIHGNHFFHKDTKGTKQ